jgi:glycerol-3-phosphate dehydrogenase (NAD(P)+)
MPDGGMPVIPNVESRPIAVIGLGFWGTALCQHLAKAGNRVIGWARDLNVVRSINEGRRHPKLFVDQLLHEGLSATDSLSSLAESRCFVYALPSRTLGEIITQIPLATDSIFVSVMKGLEPKTQKTPLQYLQITKGESVHGVVLTGPSFALDVISGRPCGLVAASAHAPSAKLVAEMFSHGSVRVYQSRDQIGAELGGIVKNVIAIAAGVSDGLGLGESSRAGLITRGLAELARLAQHLGAEPNTLYGLSGLGDLLMTATSHQSRNYTVGFRLGSGEKLVDIECTLGSTAEGVAAAPLVANQARAFGIEMPICTQVERLLAGEVSPHDVVQALLTRPLKHE